MNEELKDIHTQINKNLWLQAQINNIKWKTAIETGIKILIGIFDNEEEINKKIQKNNNENIILENKLKEIKNKKIEEKEKEEENIIFRGNR